MGTKQLKKAFFDVFLSLQNAEFKMGCCDNIIKYVIFLFNFVVFLCSVALIGIGAYIQVQMNKYLDFLGDTYLNTSVILIIIGGVMLLISLDVAELALKIHVWFTPM